MEAESPLEFRLVHTARVTPSYGLPVRSAFLTTLQGLCLHALVISMLFFQDRYTEGFGQLSHGGPKWSGLQAHEVHNGSFQGRNSNFETVTDIHGSYSVVHAAGYPVHLY